KKNMENTCNKTPPSLEKIWNVDPKKIVELRKSANKYDVLSNDMDALEFDGDMKLEGVIHSFLTKLSYGFQISCLEHQSSGKSADMIEFNDTLNCLEVEYICSSGFQFTWTKSLKNPQCDILKKLDRILINDEFLQSYQAANGVFLSYVVSDHNPVVLHIKNERLKSIQANVDKRTLASLVFTGNWGRGLRQGDPISPYLFTLVTEVFSLIMEKNIEESNEYGYHFGCKDLKLSHMCFADDLLVLCQGNKASIEVVKKSLKEFSHVSGLVPNLGKSIIFFGSINERDKIDLLQVLPFKCGRLPVRYLGVPLLAKKLGMYWASVYLLPITVSNDLEKLFKRFLWNAGDSAKGKARVA
ncbi:RNA-directed DNA polymerase, eukaryota, reverse transcriptase zinc-binding domain protein, partial [Tanacetum coccineum]